ncbi:MAG: hypothetical protein WC626_07340 [Methanoregula sp.]
MPDTGTSKKNTITVCTGHIPHLTSRLFYKNRWEERIVGGKNLAIINEGGYSGKIYFQRPGPKKDASKFNEMRIVGFNGDVVERTKIKKIRDDVKSFPYIATCRPVDDTNKTEHLFFVLKFDDSNWNHLDSIYIFKRVCWNDHKKAYLFLKNLYSDTPEDKPENKKVLLLYLSIVKVECLTDDGHITVRIDKDNLLTNHTPGSSFGQYLKESYMVVRDFLHEHTHHPNPSNNPEDSVPDSLVIPFFHDVVLSESGEIISPIINQNVINNLITIYQSSLVHHIEQTTALLNQIDQKDDFKEPDKYIQVLSLLKEADGICVYFHKYIRDLENNTKNVKRLQRKSQKNSSKRPNKEAGSKLEENNITAKSEMEIKSSESQKCEPQISYNNLNLKKLRDDRHQSDDMSRVFQTLYTEVETRLNVFQASRAVEQSHANGQIIAQSARVTSQSQRILFRSEKILFITLFLTGIIIIFTLKDTITSSIALYWVVGPYLLIGLGLYYAAYCWYGEQPDPKSMTAPKAN